ncbi:transcriptional regulator [Streptomyces sp. 4N509B]|uniref:transcriptional regulator n=1 Tax=Streptomyces sp. 4N509B TaxID=3457413 RepID=UPI003FD5228D
MSSMRSEELLRLTIAAVRAQTGETQADLAAALGLSQGQLSRKLRTPQGTAWTLDDVDRLAAHWRMRPLDLLAGPTHALEHLGTTTAPTKAPAPPSGPAQQTPAHPPTPTPPPGPNPTDGQTPTHPHDSTNDQQTPPHPPPPTQQPTPPTPPPAGTDQTRHAPHPAPRTPHPTPQQPPDPAAPEQLITHQVQQALTQHDGDIDEARATLIKSAIPDVMTLLDACRTGARYDVVAHPPLPGILRKKSAHGADDVWEARPRWTRPHLPPGEHHVTVLDINGAYLSALKTHLPLGALEYSTGDVHSRRRAGLHLITPPEWHHDAELPNPLGDRDEPGPLWITEPTLRLLQRLSSQKHGALCDPPTIHESLTSGSTEHLFERLRQVLRDAREKAITDNDETTLEYVKAMYSKFVSTMGESNYNRELYRPDWMHIIRSQAFVNLWLKAHKAHSAGLTVVRAMGTDELHVIGDWQKVFAEGRGLAQVKVKDSYTTSHSEQ